MRIAGIVAAVVTLASLHAHADNSRAWNAAKAALPGDAKVVVSVDFAAIQKTQLFATLYPKLLDKADAAKMIDTMKTTCKIDPLASVQGVVFATADDQQDGAVYIALTGVDKAKLSSCLKASAQSADKAAKVTLKHDGNVTQVSDGKSTRFVGWATKDVVIVSFHSDDKASLAKWMGGKGAHAKSSVGKTIAKVNTGAALWGAGEATKEIQPGITVKGGYGALAIVKGSLDADIHAVLETAAQATTLAGTTRKQLDETKQAAMLPPAIASLLKTVTVNAANDEVVVKANFLEADLLTAIQLAMSGLGGP